MSSAGRRCGEEGHRYLVKARIEPRWDRGRSVPHYFAGTDTGLVLSRESVVLDPG